MTGGQRLAGGRGARAPWRSARAGAWPRQITGTRADAARDLRVGDGRGGIAQAQDRQLRVADLRHPRPRRASASSTWSSRAARSGCVDNGNVRGQPFLDIRGRVSTGGERGLLSIAFDPHYARNHLFYAYYTNGAGNIEIDEFRARVQHASASEGSRRRVIVIPHPGVANHNGGQLQFGPDGKLYAGTGDGGGAGDPRENAQNKQQAARQAPAHQPPQARLAALHGRRASNPYVGKAGRNEIYALGLRNPFRFSFDRGRIADRRRRARTRWEEVDYEARTAPARRQLRLGPLRGRPPLRLPRRQRGAAAQAPLPAADLRVRAHRLELRVGGGCAIIGGYVVRDRKLQQPPRPLPLRRLLHRRAAQLRRPPPPRQARQGAGRPRRPPELVRRGRATGRSTSPPWTARSTGSSAGSRRRPQPATPAAGGVESAADGGRHRERDRNPPGIARRSLGRRRRDASRSAARPTAR